MTGGGTEDVPSRRDSPSLWDGEWPRGYAYEPTPEPAHIDVAAMYVAGLLRIFATARVDGLMLEEGDRSAEVGR
jgi:hypothetical protein